MVVWLAAMVVKKDLWICPRLVPAVLFVGQVRVCQNMPLES